MKQVKLRDYFHEYSCRQRLFIRMRYFSVPWKKLLQYTGSMRIMLDYGCGHGLFTALVKIQNPSCSIVAYDHDEKKFHLASLMMKIWNDVSVPTPDESPFRRAYYDMVALNDVLYCMTDDQQQYLLRRIQESLKPGGILLLKETVNRPRLKALFCRIQEFFALKVFSYTKGDYLPLKSATHYASLLEKAGFEIMEASPVGRLYPWPHYFFLGKKLNRG
jgi:2-polyprenyl-3-methyl-5-hydroxy-6-metoxy-1,4-benzoquinol methylase